MTSISGDFVLLFFFKKKKEKNNDRFYCLYGDCKSLDFDGMLYSIFCKAKRQAGVLRSWHQRSRLTAKD